jgi:hypothetical protein
MFSSAEYPDILFELLIGPRRAYAQRALSRVRSEEVPLLNYDHPVLGFKRKLPTSLGGGGVDKRVQDKLVAHDLRKICNF